MATDHRKVDTESAQAILLDDPSFLRQIVERVLQEVLEAEMTQHVGARPTSVARLARGTETVTSPGL